MTDSGRALREFGRACALNAPMYLRHWEEVTLDKEMEKGEWSYDREERDGKRQER